MQETEMAKKKAKPVIKPADVAEIPDWDKLQSQINTVIGSVPGNSITISQLMKDILETFGYDLSRAAQTYEYTSVVEMLSHMVESVFLRITPQGLRVSATVVGASAHVTDMIQKTRTKRKAKRPGYHQPQLGSSNPPVFGSSNPNFVPRPVFGSSNPNFVPRPVFGSSNPNFVPRPPWSQFHPVQPKFGSSNPRYSTTSQGFFARQPSSAHVYRSAPGNESPILSQNSSAPPLTFQSDPSRPAFSRIVAAQLASAQKSSGETSEFASSQNSSVRTSEFQGFGPVLISSSSEKATPPQKASVRTSEFQGFGPVLISSSSGKAQLGSAQKSSGQTSEFVSSQNASVPTSEFQGFGPVLVFSSGKATPPSPQKASESTLPLPHNENVKLPKKPFVISPLTAQDILFHQLRYRRPRPIPPPRPSKDIPQKINLPQKPRILTPSEASLWVKKSFDDYASIVGFKRR